MSTPVGIRLDDGPDGPFRRAAAWAWAWRDFDIGLPDTEDLPDAEGLPVTGSPPEASAAPRPASPDTPASPAPVLPAAAAPEVQPCPVRRRPRSARRRHDHRLGADPRR